MGTIQKNESLNYWREFFATAKNSSIFDVLDQAITLAASDFPEEFSRQRSRILGSIQGLGGGDDRRSDLGFGTGSETGSEQKAEPSKPSLKVRIKIVKRNVDGTLIKPSSDEAKPIKPSSDENKSIKPETCVDKVALDRAKMIKPPPCVGEPKSIKPIAKPYLDEAAFEAKLQATKRKFHDRYEEIENSKRQRRIQVLSYLPKQDFKIGCRPSTKPQGKKLGNHFLQASHRVNGVELRGCKIKYSDSDKGFGIFAANDVSDGVLLVVPLDLAITPMRVLQDPFFGPECRAMFEEGDVDDRFLMVLFLTVERLRKSSSWKPYLDMLPTTFGNPLWFTDDELLELKGTTLYRATELQKKSLRSLYDDKLKALVDKLLTLDGDSERDVCFEDFLWANSVFWARALNIPLPYSYVFPQVEEKKNCSATNDKSSDDSTNMVNGNGKECQVDGVDVQVNGVTSVSKQKDTVWVEGLVPGIDFCNHGLKPAATWEVDGTGSITRVPFSMYLLSAGQPLETDEEISISYGNKGNEELLHLYGFVLDGNPDDYLMVHYPVQALQSVSFSDSKAQLLEAQKAEMRCLLPRSLLDHGFFPVDISTNEGSDEGQLNHVCSYSWSGQRKMPSYLNKLVFPESFLTTLRTVAMKEDELFQVSSLLEELVTSGGGRQPSDSEVRAAIWEACGDSGALQMLVDLLTMRMVDLQDDSGTEDSDTNLLKNARFSGSPNLHTGNENDLSEEINGLQPPQSMSRNKWSSIVYRRGQKQLTRLFLKEAEHALQLALDEGN